MTFSACFKIYKSLQNYSFLLGNVFLVRGTPLAKNAMEFSVFRSRGVQDAYKTFPRMTFTCSLHGWLRSWEAEEIWNLAEMQTANRSLPIGFGGAGMVEGGLFSFPLSRAAGKFFMYIILWLFFIGFLYFCKPRSAKFLSYIRLFW